MDGLNKQAQTLSSFLVGSKTIKTTDIVTALQARIAAANIVQSTRATWPLRAGRYIVVDGTVVANDWASLTSGTLLHEIDTTELGGPAPASGVDSGGAPAGCGTSLVWTNTREDGSLGDNGDSSCSDWTDGSSTLGGGNAAFWGASNRVTNWSGWCEGGGCDATAPLFCIEQ